MSSILSDTEKSVVQTITMRMHTDEALSYLKDCGFKMARRSYFRYKKKVESMKWQRLVHAANLFTEQHLQRLDKLELIEQLMWKCFQEENSPFKKTCILEKIANVQPFISNYYDATQFVLSCRLKTDIIANPEKPALEKFTTEEQRTIKSMTPLSGQDYSIK